MSKHRPPVHTAPLGREKFTVFNRFEGAKATPAKLAEPAPQPATAACPKKRRGGGGLRTGQARVGFATKYLKSRKLVWYIDDAGRPLGSNGDIRRLTDSETEGYHIESFTVKCARNSSNTPFYIRCISVESANTEKLGVTPSGQDNISCVLSVPNRMKSKPSVLRAHAVNEKSVLSEILKNPDIVKHMQSYDRLLAEDPERRTWKSTKDLVLPRDGMELASRILELMLRIKKSPDEVLAEIEDVALVKQKSLYQAATGSKHGRPTVDELSKVIFEDCETKPIYQLATALPWHAGPKRYFPNYTTGRMAILPKEEVKRAIAFYRRYNKPIEAADARDLRFALKSFNAAPRSGKVYPTQGRVTGVVEMEIDILLAKTK